LHNTGASTPYLSLFARMPGFTRDMLDEEMYARKSLVRLRCMRNTMHVLPRDLVPAAFAATWKISVANAGRFLQFRGVSNEEYERVSNEIVTLLADGGRTTAELKRAVGPVTDLPAVLTLLCDTGVLVRGETPGWRSNAYMYHRFEKYLPGLSLDVAESVAIAELVRLYFAAFGPSTVEDFVWWSGVGKTKALAALKDMPVEHVDIIGVEGDYILLTDDLHAMKKTDLPASGTVNLLPGLDPYIMGYKRRDRYLSRDYYDFVFDRSGNSAGTIVVDGRIIGIWDYAGEGPQVKYFLFEDADENVRGKITVEAKRIGHFIFDRPVPVRECRSMVPLTQRTAGGVMSPLKGQ